MFLNSQIMNPQPTLWDAVIDRDYVLVEQLIRKKADVNEENEGSNESPLHIASNYGYAEIVNLLLDHGAKANQVDTVFGESPLLFSCGEGHAEVVKVLLRHKANPNQTSVYEGTGGATSPLFVACDRGHLSVVRLLLRFKAYPDSTGDIYQLHGAAQRGHLDVCQALIEKGAETNSKRAVDDVCPLDLATEHGFEDIVRLLLFKKADVCFDRYIKRDSPLTTAGKKGYTGIVSLLLRAGANVAIERSSWLNLATPPCRDLVLSCRVRAAVRRRLFFSQPCWRTWARSVFVGSSANPFKKQTVMDTHHARLCFFLRQNPGLARFLTIKLVLFASAC